MLILNLFFAFCVSGFLFSFVSFSFFHLQHSDTKIRLMIVSLPCRSFFSYLVFVCLHLGSIRFVFLPASSCYLSRCSKTIVRSTMLPRGNGVRSTPCERMLPHAHTALEGKTGWGWGLTGGGRAVWAGKDVCGFFRGKSGRRKKS